MDYLPVIGCVLLGFGIVLSAIPLILRVTARIGARRSWDLHHTHTAPVPRFGGLALAIAFSLVEIIIWLAFPENRAKVPGRNAAIIGSLAMFALGFTDDLRPIGAKRKLVGQILVALAVACAGISIQQFQIPFTGQIIQLGHFGLVVTVLWLVALTNLINLIDGIDGLAGGICLMLMLLLVYVGQASGSFVMLTAGMVGALIGFLCYNFPPAKIYLGDGGAYFLGFQIGLFSISSSHKGSVVAALVSPLFVLALPILDTSLAIARRGLRGLPLFRPDRRHLHHHMLQMGISRRHVVLGFYALTLVFLAMGFAAFFSRGQLVPILLGIAALVILLCATQYSFSRRWFAVGRTLGGSLAIRQEVQYALCLTEWLKHEGRRVDSLEELWQHLAFAAQRLGFSSIRLTLADGVRSWSSDTAVSHDATLRWERFDLHRGSFGVLEFGYPAGSSPAQESRVTSLEICAELLAEGWVKAARAWGGTKRLTLRFDMAHPAAASPDPAEPQPPPREVVPKDEPLSP